MSAKLAMIFEATEDEFRAKVREVKEALIDGV